MVQIMFNNPQTTAFSKFLLLSRTPEIASVGLFLSASQFEPMHSYVADGEIPNNYHFWISFTLYCDARDKEINIQL